MGFWQDLWQGTRRAFCKSCPKCKANDADLPANKKMQRVLISQKSHWHSHYEWHDGKMIRHNKLAWDKDLHFTCRCCGHEWHEHLHNQPFAG